MPKHAYGVRCVTCGGDATEFHTSSEAIREYAAMTATLARWHGHVVELLERDGDYWTVWLASDDAGDTP